MKVIVTSDALGDVVAGRFFYESQCPGLGDYFEQAVVLEVESLQFYAGTHPKRTGGFYRMLIRRFPYAIHYSIVGDEAHVWAILDSRRNPVWTARRLNRPKKTP